MMTGCGNAASQDQNTETGTQTESAATETSEAEAETTVADAETETEEQGTSWTDPIDGMSEDFMMGVDLSSVLVEENSGVKFYNFDGEEQDVFKTFADAGVNYARFRVWNNPYDENGNGYGGGNNDLATAITLGKRATDYGMRVFIDFHYSDFWADPNRQYAPKAWADMDLDTKSEALYEFTKDSLKSLLDEGVDVGMVQIGNEINYGMCGETKIDNVITLLKAGSKAVREVSEEYGKDIDIAVHYTRIIDKANVLDLVSKLVDSELDFDMIGMSYYSFWDDSMDNMKRVLELIQERYNKKVFLAETSYAYTLEDGDGNSNNFASESDVVDGYPATADNSPIWEEYGSGWASSYASDYDPDQAGKYYGGSAWDNQAFFDFNGNPLESINVFKYMREGK